MSDEHWFRNAFASMLAGLAWFLAAEAMFRLGASRLADDLYIGSANPLARLMILQLFIYFVAVTVAAIVSLRLFLLAARSASLETLLPGVALAGSLRVLVSMDSGLQPVPWWFEVARFAIVTIIPLALAMWMFRRRRAA